MKVSSLKVPPEFSKCVERPKLAFIRLNGFTLIELLTVIAIIGILAAIIIPTVGRVRQTAKEGVNKSNLRQLSMAANIYANENKDYYPAAYDSTPFNAVTNPHGGDQFFDTLATILYSNNTDRFKGKGDKIVTVSPTATWTPLDPITRSINHYSMHKLLGGEKTSGLFKGGKITRSACPRPSQVILFVDGCVSETVSGTANVNVSAQFYKPSAGIDNNYTGPLTDPIPTDGDTDGNSADRGTIRYRNNGSAHASMVDGSVKSFKKGTVTYANIVAWQ